MEKTMLGYQNKVVRIDLTKKGVSFEPLRMDFAKKYVGSKGLAIRYMYEELKPGIDPLGPENKLFLTTGPLTGTPVPCSGKLSVAAKSPATGTMNDCSIGGHVGIRLKFAGYDMAIFEGWTRRICGVSVLMRRKKFWRRNTDRNSVSCPSVLQGKIWV